FVVTWMSWMPDDSKLIINQQKGEFGQLYEISLSDASMKPSKAAEGQLQALWQAVSAKTGAVAWNDWRYRVNLIRVDLQNPKAAAEPILQSSRDERQASLS